MGATDRYRFKSKLALFTVTLALKSICAVAGAQELNVDADRVFTTSLRWERVSGAPQGEKLRDADGTLVILYRDGTYAEVAASFIKTNSKVPISLDLNEGFIVRLGTWTRTEDEELIHIQSREVLRDKIIRKLHCNETPSDKACSPVPDPPLPGPLTMRTCRLEHHSDKQLAEAIVCKGLTVFRPGKPIDLSDFPSIVRKMVAAQNEKSGATH